VARRGGGAGSGAGESGRAGAECTAGPFPGGCSDADATDCCAARCRRHGDAPGVTSRHGAPSADADEGACRRGPCSARCETCADRTGAFAQRAGASCPSARCHLGGDVGARDASSPDAPRSDADCSRAARGHAARSDAAASHAASGHPDRDHTGRSHTTCGHAAYAHAPCGYAPCGYSPSGYAACSDGAGSHAAPGDSAGSVAVTINVALDRSGQRDRGAGYFAIESGRAGADRTRAGDGRAGAPTCGRGDSRHRNRAGTAACPAVDAKTGRDANANSERSSAHAARSRRPAAPSRADA